MQIQAHMAAVHGDGVTDSKLINYVPRPTWERVRLITDQRLCLLSPEILQPVVDRGRSVTGKACFAFYGYPPTCTADPCEPMRSRASISI